jgi:hypothetical protein
MTLQRAFARIIWFVLLNSVVVLYPLNGVAADSGIEECRVAWAGFLSERCATGQTEQSIRKLMSGTYRDIGMTRINAQFYRLLFLLDDFHQVEFVFDKESRLLLSPTVEPRGQWLRSPNGAVQTIPDPNEARLRSQAEESAMKYVVGHTHHAQDTMAVYCKRGAKAQTWDVVVTINSLQVDTPSYLLEVNDNGQVRMTRP